MFPPGSRVGNFGILKFSVSREICVGIPGIFSYVSNDFRGTDIHDYDIKNASLQSLNFFLLTKNYFPKFSKFFKTKC